MRLESSVNLLVAALDLKLVRLLRAAMNAGDCCKPGGPCHLVQPGPRFEPRKRVEPEPVIEPRRHIHPEPRFEPRPVIRPSDRDECCPPAAPIDAPAPKSSTSPIEPPWKILPWEDHPSAPSPRALLTVKVVTGRSDQGYKGNLIDLFI